MRVNRLSRHDRQSSFPSMHSPTYPSIRLYKNAMQQSTTMWTFTGLIGLCIYSFDTIMCNDDLRRSGRMSRLSSYNSTECDCDSLLFSCPIQSRYTAENSSLSAFCLVCLGNNRWDQYSSLHSLHCIVFILFEHPHHSVPLGSVCFISTSFCGNGLQEQRREIETVYTVNKSPWNVLERTRSARGIY